jgi:hypothetical protein
MMTQAPYHPVRLPHGFGLLLGRTSGHQDGQGIAMPPHGFRKTRTLPPLGQPALRLPPVCRPQGWAALWRVMGAAISQSESSVVFA